MTTFNAETVTARDIEVLRSKWVWLLLAGLALIAFGVIAAINVVAATVASVLFVGTMMVVAGVAQIVHAFQVKTWKNFLLWLVVGALYVVAGFLAFINPLLASAALTLLFSVSVIAAGVLRVVAGIQLRPEQGWGWLVAAGVLTFVIGLILLAGWPINSLWIIGFLLAIDLISSGVALAIFAVTVKNAGRRGVTRAA